MAVNRELVVKILRDLANEYKEFELSEDIGWELDLIAFSIEQGVYDE